MNRDALAATRAAGPSGRSACRRSLCAAVLLGLLLFPSLASAAYKIESGDVLEINVLGAPGLHRTATVDATGHIALLIIGDVPAAGLTLPELREKLSAQLVAKNVMHDPEVEVEVKEYRPIYVGGDVMKPGSYSYRIGMNVRDAVALAEGYDLLHLRGRDLMLEGADARGQYNGSGIELAKQAARIARIRAELAGANNLDVSSLKELPVSPAVENEIIQAERQQLAADNNDAARQKAYLERMMAQTKEQLAAVTAAGGNSGAAYRQAMQNVTRANDLLKRGLIAKQRVEEAQGAAVSAQGNLTDVTARANQARQDLANFTRQYQQVDEQRHTQLLQDLQQAVAAAATARAQLQAAAQKVVYTNAAQQQLASGTLGKRASIVIYRQSGTGKQEQLRGAETTALMPGDNVQITSDYDLNDLVKMSASDGASRSRERSAAAALADQPSGGSRPSAGPVDANGPAPDAATRAARQ